MMIRARRICLMADAFFKGGEDNECKRSNSGTAHCNR